MKFEAGTGTLWASVVGGAGANFRDNLATISLTTGQTAVVIPLPVTTDGIAVTSGALPPGVGSSVPTLSEWAQVVLVSLMVLVGLVALRRRRSA
jgi:hypothetical protein